MRTREEQIADMVACMRRDNSGFAEQTLAYVAKEFLEEIEKRILLSSKVEVDPQVTVAASEMSAEQKMLPAWAWLNPETGDISYGRWSRVAGKVAPYIRADLALEAERRAEQRVRAEIGRVANDVVSERNRQSEVEGFSASRDDLYTDFQLSRAASVYAQIAGYSDAARNAQAYIGHSQWPWDYSWLKPTTRRHDLVKAAALLFAEIERLDREAIDAAREVG